MKFFEQKFLLFSILLSFTLVAMETPMWVGLSTVVVLIWKWLIEKKNFTQPSRKITAFLAIVLLLLIWLQYRTLLGQEPSTALLLGLLSLRIMDYGRDRDHKFVVLLGFVILAVKFLFTIDFYWLIPGLLAFAGFWLSLINTKIEKPLLFLTKVFAFSLPLTAFLFFLFPRLSIPWAHSQSATKASSGFTDHLNPGEVASLSNSSELVFRAQFFSDARPSFQNLYWRGLAIHESSGLSWRNSKPLPPKWYQLKKESLWKYQIVLEPQDHPFLFVLDTPIKVFADSFEVLSAEARTFRSIQSTDKRLVYEASSSLGIADAEKDMAEYLQVPELSDKVRTWVSEIKSKYQQPKERLQRLEDFFQKENFFYSRSPGVFTAKNDLEEFLFEKKRGFCEHFAGAYATLARALDIPSRVITGYHGGDFNSFGDFYKITQRDAHAWVEIYDKKNQRWERKDPTEWVAPLRIELGAKDFFDLPEDMQKSSSHTSFEKFQNNLNNMWISNLQDGVEGLNYKWTQWLMNFDQANQINFLNSLPFSPGWLLVFFLVVLFLTNYALKRIKFVERRKDSRLMLEQIFKWGEKQGFPKTPSEAPLVYLNRLASQKQDFQSSIVKAAEIYDLSVYQNHVEFEKQAKQFIRSWPG